MSIRSEIVGRVAEGRLIQLTQLIPSRRPDQREIFMTRPIADALNGPWPTPSVERRWGQARAILESFTRGDQVVGRMPPSKNVNTVIALLEPADENNWEFRIGDPKPGLRIFGRFAERDVFIAANWEKKEDLIHNTIGAKKLYRDPKVQCSTEWRNLFPAYPAHRGTTIHDYISNSRL
jgi:hypothetical protein